MKTQKRGGAAEPDSKAAAGKSPGIRADRNTAPASPRRNGVSPKHAHAVNGHRQASEDTTPEATVKAPRKAAARTEGTAARLSIRVAAERPADGEGHYALPATSSIVLPPSYRPSPDEEYMNPRQLAYFRQRLRDWREELLEESRQTVESLRHEVRDVGDEAERATRETENSLELRTRDRYRKLISKIERALRKIEQGRYGYCEETAEQIGLERLEARPIAALSLDAQERREHLQKQEGD